MEPEDIFEINPAGNLRPVKKTGTFTQEHGVFVFHAGELLPASATDKMSQQIREERDLANITNSDDSAL